MASSNVVQQEQVHNDSASTIASDFGGWELGGIESNNKVNEEMLAKLVARMTALEAENKLFQEQKGLF
jgi:hypothetical protein